MSDWPSPLRSEVNSSHSAEMFARSAQAGVVFEDPMSASSLRSFEPSRSAMYSSDTEGAMRFISITPFPANGKATESVVTTDGFAGGKGRREVAERRKLTDRLVASMRCPPGKSGLEITDIMGKLSAWVGPAQKPFFRYRYTLNGNTKRITVGAFSDEFGVEIARATVAQYELMRIDGKDPQAWEVEVAAENRGTTVADVLDHHLEGLRSRESRYNADKLYKDLRARYGTTALVHFTPAVAKAFIETNYEHRKGAARSLVRNANAAFNKVLSVHSGFDRPRDYVNPFKDVRKAVRWWGEHRVKNHAQAFEAAEWQALSKGILAAYKTDTNKSGIQILELLLMTGARPSEISSLKLSEIREVDGIAWIDKDAHKMAHKGQERRIWLMPQAMDVINAAKAENARYRYKGDYLFPQRFGRKNQRRAYVNTLNHYMEIVSELAGIRVTPYALRGAYISFALDTLGIEWLEMVSQNAGHADPTITLKHYRKHRPSKLVDAARLVGEALERVRVAQAA
jgi:integrase